MVNLFMFKELQVKVYFNKQGDEPSVELQII